MKKLLYTPLKWGYGPNIIAVCLIFFIGSSMLSCSDDRQIPDPVERENAKIHFKNDLVHSLPGLSDLIDNKGNGLGQKEIDREIQRMLGPAIQSGKRLLSTYGAGPEFLTEEFGSDNDPRILTASLIFAGLEDREFQRNTASLLAFLVQEPENGDKDWFDCAIRAVGIDAVMEMLNGRITASISKKAIKKIATRSLGWVGAAIAAYEFAKCMGWV